MKVKINLCAECFRRVERAPMRKVSAILLACPTCKGQVQALRVASKLHKTRLTYGDALDVLRGFR